MLPADNIQACDGLIFDMDGTLWDAVTSYALVWNRTLADCGIDRPPVTRADLISLMGRHLDYIAKVLVPDMDRYPDFLARLSVNDNAVMPVHGGVLYPHVRRTLERLQPHIPLYMVSNCGDKGLDNFLDYTHLRPLFRDWLTNGGTGRPKGRNIRDLVDKYDMKAPLYVGDTQTDRVACRDAGVDMVYCAYGFGKAADPAYTIHNFAQLSDIPPVAAALTDNPTP